MQENKGAPDLRENKMGTMPLGKLLFNMALPLVLSMLVQALYNVVDSIYVAGYSQNAVTALSLAFPIQNLQIGFATGIAVGVNSLLSKSLGEGNRERANRAAGNGIFLILLGGIAFMLFGAFGSRLFYEIQSDVAETVEGGTVYTSICCLCTFAVFFEKNDGTVMFHSLYNSYVDAVDNARWKITVNRIAPVIAESDVKQAIIYQRSDYVSSGFPTQLANLHFPITVDLNGKTLTAPTLMNTDHNSASNADREITYKNGTILTSSSWGVIYMQVNNGTPAVDMTLTVNFENINFGFAKPKLLTRSKK